MATMFISEYESLAINGTGGAIQAGQEPALEEQQITYSTEAKSTAFNTKTKFVRISCDTEAYLLFGEGVTVTVSNSGKQVQADTPEFFGVVGGHVVSAVNV